VTVWNITASGVSKVPPPGPMLESGIRGTVGWGDFLATEEGEAEDSERGNAHQVSRSEGRD